MQSFLRTALASPEGDKIENADGFQNSSLYHQSSTLRTKHDDQHGSISEIVIDVYAEGRASVTTQWYRSVDLEPQNREVREIIFTNDESAASVAGRILAAIVNSPENDVDDYIRHFVDANSAGENPAPF